MFNGVVVGSKESAEDAIRDDLRELVRLGMDLTAGVRDLLAAQVEINDEQSRVAGEIAQILAKSDMG